MGDTYLLDSIKKEPTMSRACFLVEPEDRRRLALLAQTGSKRMAIRARVVLLSEQGLTVEQIASELSIVPPTVYKWRRRFAERGIAGLYDLPRPGQPLKLTEERKQAIVRLVTEAVPEDALEWSIRRLAKVAGVTEHQARSVLGSRRPASDAVTPLLRWPLQLGAVCLAPPLAGAVLLVDAQRAASDAPLGPAYARLGHYRKDPRSLYRAFCTSERTSAPRDQQIARMLDALGEFSGSVHPSRALELVVAPAGAFTTAPPAELRRTLTMVLLPSVSVWLRTLESTLLWLEDEALGPDTDASEVKALRLRLAQHNALAEPRNGSEFLWKNPCLNAVPNSER